MSRSLMSRHLELPSQPVESTAQMVSNAGDFDSQDLGDLALSPAEPVDQHDSDPLPLGETCEGFVESRLHPWKFVHGGRWEHDPAALTAGVVASNPIDVPGPVLHRPDPLPVLPRIGQPLREGLHRRLHAHGRDQRPTKPKLALIYKGRELGRPLILQRSIPTPITQ